MDFLVKPSRSGGCGVQSVVMVSGADDTDVVILLKAVHFGKKLVDRGSGGASLVR